MENTIAYSSPEKIFLKNNPKVASGDMCRTLLSRTKSICFTACNSLDGGASSMDADTLINLFAQIETNVEMIERVIGVWQKAEMKKYGKLSLTSGWEIDTKGLID